MTTKYIIFFFFLSILCFSCNKESDLANSDNNAESKLKMVFAVKGVSSNAATVNENQLNSVDIFSFSQKPGDLDYTFEKRFENLTPTLNGDKNELTMTLIGSLPRIFYYIANNTTNIPFFASVSSTTSSTEFEDNALLLNSAIPTAPLTLVGKVVKPDPKDQDNLSVELSHVVARLDVVNMFKDFEVDSLVLKNAVAGTSLFQNTIPSTTNIARVNINYATDSTIYLYQVNDATLAVYGKVKGARAVVDIHLAAIKSATRYKVTFRDSESSIEPSGNLLFDVNPWTNGGSVGSTPDWN